MVLRAPFTSEHSDLNPFLYAPIGADAAGTPVTVATAMARAGVDPREEAKRGARFSAMIAASDVSDTGDIGATADRLIGLLPRRRRAPAPSTRRTARAPSSALFWVVCLGMVALFVLSAIGDNAVSIDATPSGANETFPRHPLP
jgi:hypothetical protein